MSSHHNLVGMFGVQNPDQFLLSLSENSEQTFFSMFFCWLTSITQLNRVSFRDSPFKKTKIKRNYNFRKTMRFTILVLVVQSVTSISNQNVCFSKNEFNQQKIKIKKILHDEILRAGIVQRGKHLMLLYNLFPSFDPNYWPYPFNLHYCNFEFHSIWNFHLDISIENHRFPGIPH